MNRDLQQQFIQHWRKEAFTQPGQKVLLAVSGGVDSMTLAHLMLHAGIDFALAHCNFQLRGEDSVLDAQLVQDWADKHQLKLHSIAFDTEEEMQQRGKGVQETARALRYEWFRSLCGDHGYACVATAHHANDNAETLLINLCKGTGMAGLHAIPQRNGLIIRPLLFAERETITAFAAAMQIPYREDASNASDKYLRNAVRHQLMPVLEQLFPGATGRLSDDIRRFSQAEVLYNRAIAQERKQLIEQRGRDFYVPIRKLRHRAPLETICYELFAPFGFSPDQATQVLQLLDSESGHYISSASHRIIRDRDFLIVTTLAPEAADRLLIDTFPCTLELEHHTIRFSIIDKPATLQTPDHIALLDLSVLMMPLQLRRWRMGDYFYPLGMQMKKKKVGRFLIDRKVPLHQKEQLWILESDKRIAWLAGLRPDERFRVKAAATQVLQVELLER